eukprot:6382344-Pyramimonas_sp.AAC.1
MDEMHTRASSPAHAGILRQEKRPCADFKPESRENMRNAGLPNESFATRKSMCSGSREFLRKPTVFQHYREALCNISKARRDARHRSPKPSATVSVQAGASALWIHQKV